MPWSKAEASQLAVAWAVKGSSVPARNVLKALPLKLVSSWYRRTYAFNTFVHCAWKQQLHSTYNYMLCHVPCSGPHFARMARSDRQRLLREQYFFDCCCPTCLRGCVCIRQVVYAAMQFCCTLTGCPAPSPVQLLLPAYIHTYCTSCCWRGWGTPTPQHFQFKQDMKEGCVCFTAQYSCSM